MNQGKYEQLLMLARSPVREIESPNDSLHERNEATHFSWFRVVFWWCRHAGMVIYLVMAVVQV